MELFAEDKKLVRGLRRAEKDGQSQRSGIHLRADGLIQKLPVDAVTARQIKPQTFSDLFPAVMREFHASHALVDRLYKLEGDVPALKAPLPRQGPIVDFARDRLRASATFTASLYQTAWRNSANVDIPHWHHRPK